MIGDGQEFEVGGLPCTGFPYRIVKKEQPQAIGGVQAAVGDGADVMSCHRENGRWMVRTAEAGTLQVYTLTGQLCRTQRCRAGSQWLDLPQVRRVYVLRFVSETGRAKSLKIM